MSDSLYFCFILEERALRDGPIGSCVKAQGMVSVTEDLDAAIAGARAVYQGDLGETALIMVLPLDDQPRTVRLVGELPGGLLHDVGELLEVVLTAEARAAWEVKKCGIAKLMG